MLNRRPFDRNVMEIDAAAVARDIEQAMLRIVSKELHRQGVVVGVSGGIDSAVCVSLAVRAFGPERVVALLMPENDLSSAGTRRARTLLAQLGVTPVVENITPALDGLGCYRRRDGAIRRLFPDYEPGWRHKIALAGGLLDQDRVNYFTLTVETPTGELHTARMPVDVYLEVVAATNFKQRIRKTIEYFHADARNYAVIGTPNKLEYDLGFFVRGGDGLADLKPIAGLYKTQVYALAAYLGVTEEIRNQPPSTDTYSLPQTQEEFYYALPFDQMDLALHAWNTGVPAAEAAAVLGMTTEQMHRVYQDIIRKRRISERLLRDAVLIDAVADQGAIA